MRSTKGYKPVPPKKGDKAIASKMINLTTDLTGLDKAVAGILIESCNSKTGKCCPSIAYIANCLRCCEKSVERALKKICGSPGQVDRLFTRYRHVVAGRANAYVPNWTLFRQTNSNFEKARCTQPTNMSDDKRQICIEKGDNSVPQNHRTNQKNRNQPEVSRNQYPITTPISSRVVINEKMNRKIDEHFRKLGETKYAIYLEQMNEELLGKAVAMERTKSGSGIGFLQGNLFRL